jgi:hypothetical protein
MVGTQEERGRHKVKNPIFPTGVAGATETKCKFGSPEQTPETPVD